MLGHCEAMQTFVFVLVTNTPRTQASVGRVAQFVLTHAPPDCGDLAHTPIEVRARAVEIKSEHVSPLLRRVFSPRQGPAPEL